MAGATSSGASRGLEMLTREALVKSGRDIPMERVIIGIDVERRE